MKQKESPAKITAALILGILLAVLAAAFVFLYISQKTEKLSAEKMAESGREAETDTDEGREPVQENEEYTKELKSFAAAGSKKSADKTAEKEEDEPEEDESDDSYLCSYSSKRLINESDISALKGSAVQGLPSGKSIIQMVINEMYAKYGYQFKSAEIQSYFDQKEWYQDIDVRNADMDAIYQGMTGIEKANVDFLSAHN